MKASNYLPQDSEFVAENAWQEVEVCLAGHDLPKEWKWQAIRSEVNPKEAYFEPFARQRGVIDLPAQGRKMLAREAARNYKRVHDRCPEDVVALEDRLSRNIE